MNTTVKRDLSSIIAGLAMILIGFAFLVAPGLTLVTIAVVAGMALIVSGLLDAYSYARYRQELGLSGWMLAAAALDIVLGAAFVVFPLVSAVVIPWIAAIAFIAYGVLEIVSAWRLAAAGKRGSTGYTRVNEKQTPRWAGFPNYARTAYSQPSAMTNNGGAAADASDAASSPDAPEPAPAGQPAAASANATAGGIRPDGFLSTIGGSWGWSLFIGLVAIACAVAFIVRPEMFALFLAFFVMIRGVVLIAHGVSTGRYTTTHAAA